MHLHARDLTKPRETTRVSYRTVTLLYQRALEFTMIHEGFEEEGRQYYRDKIKELSEKQLRPSPGPSPRA